MMSRLGKALLILARQTTFYMYYNIIALVKDSWPACSAELLSSENIWHAMKQ